MSVGGVRSIHMLRTRRIGGIASADVHVQVEPRLSVSEGHRIAVKVEDRLKEEIEEIEDVTVHIDPEDDELAPIVGDLPLRTQALSRLDQLWAEIEFPHPKESIVLHYLGGKIEVDVYLKCDHEISKSALTGFQQKLQTAVENDAEFGDIRAYVCL